MTYICTKPLTDCSYSGYQFFWDQYVCWCLLYFLKQWMYFSCPILETADYKWQDQTLRLNLCALINWQIKPNAASGVFHESFISFSNCLIVWIFPFCLNFLTSILQLFSSRNKTMTQYIQPTCTSIT